MALLVFYVIFPLFVYNRKWHWISKRVIKKRKKIPFKKLTKERLQKYSDVDVVIVGGNVSGLVAAAALTKAGVRVLVLEKKEQVGGSLVGQKRAGYTFSSTCITGSMVDSKQLVDWLVDTPIWWTKSTETALTCKYDNKNMEFHSSPKQTKDKIKETFTNEKAQERFFYHVNKYSLSNKEVFESLKLYHMPQAFRDVLQEWLCPDYMEYNKMSVSALLADCGFDEMNKLPGCLKCLQHEDDSAAELLDCFVRMSQGMYKPKEGIYKLVYELCQTVRTNGGYILTEANVENVDPETGTVKVDGMEYFFGGKIISAVSLYQTFGLLGLEEPKMNRKDNFYRVLVAFKLGAEIESKNKIVNSEGNVYKFFYGGEPEKKTLTIEYNTTDVEKDKGDKIQSLLDIGDIDREKIKWIHHDFFTCERMKNDATKMHRTNKPSTRYNNLYITGRDLLHTESLESAIRSGYITANAITNYGTFIDMLFGSELMTSV